ncbi:helix-turn-helix transcriptional regulator [Lactobacillus apis]|uniref:helix-turn-helix transcriptional regulator n=1 Tax=Lactobacillus apis TaxID=303541 RepID=UPI00242E799D|nr:helix-turn-helix transcriptional regulator [Lactobacillus apis]
MDKFIVPKQVKHTIRDLRVRARLSQDEAAQKMHISRRTLQIWENDPTKLSVGAITKISELYGIPTDYIFFGPNSAFSVSEG